ncbi:MAG: hypothetical protein WCO84_00920 [bacterium]
MLSYTFYVKKGWHENFDNVEDLKKSVARHFTARETDIVDKLTTFTANSLFDEYGMCRKKYQHYEVICYKFN